MSMRVTHRTMQMATLANMQENRAGLGSLQEQLSSGRSISRPSDNPAGTLSALQMRSEVRRTEQFQRNADNGVGWLSTADGALMDSLSTLRRVRDLTLRGASTGANGAQSREALAKEVEGLRDGLLSLANTKFNGRPVFAGAADTETAFDATGAYGGDGGAVLRRVDPNTTVQANIPGDQVFGDGATSVFALLDRVAANLRTDPTQLQGNIGELDATIGSMLGTVATIGTRQNRLETINLTATDRLIDLKASLSKVEDIDLPATIIELQMQETAYQVSLAATARVIQPTLLDFLR